VAFLFTKIMATGKKSFIAYADWKEVFEELPDAEAGQLIKHIFAYVNDENPTSDSILIRAVFANIKTTLKRDLDKWESQLEQRREAGKKSAEVRSTKSNERSTSVEIRQRNPTVSVSVNDSVNVNDIIKTNNIEERKLKFADNLKIFNITYDRNLLLEFYKYWTEPNKSNTKFRMELEKTWDLTRRLENWAKNDKSFTKQKATEIPKIDTSQNTYESKSPEEWK
tara:strand:+ start:13937 stop:14608 length:672 start_codon:yes stop_codon:yes gene_type:complete